MNQEGIFRQLTPIAVAQLIDIPEAYQSFAPDYLKEPNTDFSKRNGRVGLTSARMLNLRWA
jgi:hypothetical protein